MNLKLRPANGRNQAFCRNGGSPESRSSVRSVLRDDFRTDLDILVRFAPNASGPC